MIFCNVTTRFDEVRFALSDKKGAAGIGSAEFLWRNLFTGIAREIVITTP
ncbi:MAG TPA: hypothetical protein VGK36_14480 [Candidatus Angelobacter sp.]